jgi:hypothetical protein
MTRSSLIILCEYNVVFFLQCDNEITKNLKLDKYVFAVVNQMTLRGWDRFDE